MTGPRVGLGYRLLLLFFPRDFRERFGGEMRAFHRDRLADVRARGDSLALFWTATIADTLTSAAAERAHVMRTIMQDAAYAARSLSRRPAFTLVILATIALGVGANAAIFSVVNGVLLRPLPWPAADRIIVLGHEPPQWLASDPNFVDYRRELTSTGVLDGLAAWTTTQATLDGGSEPERVRLARVSEDFFRVMGTRPLLGRPFAPNEFEGNPPTFLILSYDIWKRRFGGDTAVLNTTIDLNGRKRTIVGVMPQHFNYPEARIEMWAPMPRFNPDSLGDRSNNYLFMVGRMKPGVPIERLKGDAASVARRIMNDFPGSFNPKNPLVPNIGSIDEQLVGKTRPFLVALLGAVGFVLLISCANVANLLLARAEGRRREMALRSALGASGRRLVTQMLTESMLLALVGSAAGLAVGWAGLRALVALAPSTIPRLDEIAIDWTVLGFTLAISLVTGALIGLVPAWRAARGSTAEALKAGGRSGAVGVTRGARHALVVAEVALAVVALTGSGMLLRSLWNLEHTDIGFTSRGAFTAQVAVTAVGSNSERSIVLVEQLIDRLSALPGVRAVGAAQWLPVVDQGGLWGVVPEGTGYGPGSGNPSDQPGIVPQHVTPGYFKAMGMTLVAGREFTRDDRAGALAVAIVTKSAAQTLWPNQDPIGKRFKLGNTQGTMPFLTVVGVAGDFLSRGFADKPEPTMYIPYGQSRTSSYFTPREMSFIIRTDGDPMTLAAPLRTAVHALEPSTPVWSARTLDAVVGTSVSTRKFSTTLLAAFAVLALVLAGIGTYGVIAYGVSQRTFEIGVRMALGAARVEVMGLIVREAVRMCAVGLVVGLAVSIVVARAMRSLLVDVPMFDLPTLGVASALLILMATIAATLPARRAVAVSPTEALRGS